MKEASRVSRQRTILREAPAWIAVVLAVTGIFLTYFETRAGNEREIIFRVWDDSWELYRYSGDFPGNSSQSQVDLEIRLLTSIHAHAGLLKDRSLKDAAVAVSQAWSTEQIGAAEYRRKLTCEGGEMIDLMAEVLGTYDPIVFPSDDAFPC